MRFFEILDSLLKERGAAAKLSASMGIPESLIGYWRRGEKQPRLENIVKLCEYFNVSSDELLGIKRPTTPEGEQSELTEHQELIAVISNELKLMDVEKLKAFKAFLGA